MASKLTQNNTGKIVLESISILDHETIIQMSWQDLFSITIRKNTSLREHLIYLVSPILHIVQEIMREITICVNDRISCEETSTITITSLLVTIAGIYPKSADFGIKREAEAEVVSHSKHPSHCILLEYMIQLILDWRLQ